ncbi:hypothetical protein SLS53_006846 [Cytospora paraplurivora]|uniref:Uncharacterized protein n=1 Tax=Cytospora paraplurivora TaxID=2898453 RepID=A0AAN9U946_9PEZI
MGRYDPPIYLLSAYGGSLTDGQEEQGSKFESGKPDPEEDDEETPGYRTEEGSDEDDIGPEPDVEIVTTSLKLTSADTKSEKVHRVLEGLDLGSLPTLVVENVEIDAANLLLRISAITDDHAVEFRDFRDNCSKTRRPRLSPHAKSTMPTNGFLDNKNATG